MNKSALSVGNPDGNARSVSETFVQAGTSQASDRARSSVVFAYKCSFVEIL